MDTYALRNHPSARLNSLARAQGAVTFTIAGCSTLTASLALGAVSTDSGSTPQGHAHGDTQHAHGQRQRDPFSASIMRLVPAFQ